MHSGQGKVFHIVVTVLPYSAARQKPRSRALCTTPAQLLGAGRWVEALHPRRFVPHEGSTLAAHRAALVAAVSGKRGKRYLKRQQLLELGEPAFLYLTEMVHRRPRQWFYDVDRLHDMLQSHGPEVLRRAMEEGINDQVFSATYVERFLERSLLFQEGIQ